MEIRIRNLGNFKDASLSIPGSCAIYDKSAAGKTTLCRIFYSFLTGIVDQELLSSGADEGEAVLRYGGKTYSLVLKKGSTPKVSTVVDGSEWGDYVVLSEFTIMYTYHQRPHDFSPEVAVSKFIKKPNTIEIDQELAEIESRLDAIKAYDAMVKSLSNYTADLSRLEAELAEVKKKLEEHGSAGELERVVELASRADALRQQIEETRALEEKLENQVKEIELQLSGFTYEEDKEKARALRERVGALERKIQVVINAENNVNEIIANLRKLEQAIDVISGLNLVVADKLVDAEVWASLIRDFEVARDELARFKAELQVDLKKLREELASVSARVDKYVDLYTKRENLLRELKKTKALLQELETKLSSLSHEIRRVENAHGKSISEIVGEYASRNTEKLALLKRKEELEQRIKDVSRTIESIKTALERVRSEDQAALLQRYEELKKAKNETDAEYQAKRKRFIEAFKASMIDLFSAAEISIQGFDPRLRFERRGHTYSKSERFLIAASYTLAVAMAAASVGVKIPYVVIDVFTPLDPRYESALMKMTRHVSKQTSIPVILLFTKDEKAVVPL